MANPIVCENSKPGNPPSEWDISGAGDPNIQGFATDISVNQGQTVRFKVNTSSSAYRIDIYRLGYYGGMGARKVATVLPSVSLPQSQPACLNDTLTGLIDCGNWAESASWAVPANATSGIYIAELVRLDIVGASHIVFIVRGDTGASKMLFQTSDTTWQAYNGYGGNSLYYGSPANRAYKVSYNRPFTTRANFFGLGTRSFLFNAEYPMVRWLEANGYDVSYFTGVDTDRNGSKILGHKVFFTVGHDEYWSRGQRDNVEAARAAGVHLAFFTGNQIFWKTRWENSIDGSNTPYRTLVCYKETHAGQPIDPNDPPTWTGTWRDPRFSPPADGGRPENALTGSIFTVNGARYDAMTVPWTFENLRFWRNTAIAALPSGQIYAMPTGTLGHEWDEDLDNGFRPAGLFDMSSTTLDVSGYYLLDYGSSYGGGTATHSLTLYRASGALVFGAGTVQWSWGLDANHDLAGLGGPADVNMQQATVNLFADMGVQPATLQPGLVPASASTDTIPPTSMITFPAAGANVENNTPITITGTATDAGGGVVAAVEVSVDGGATWHRAVGLGNWSYAWTPGALGSGTLKSRAVDDSANLEVPSAGVTVNVVPDTTPPVISGVQASPITNTWATITWSTNKLSDSQVDYGTTMAYGSSTTLDPRVVTNHSVLLGGLMPTTLYHYRVKSRDVSGNLAISPDFTFTTTSTNSTINVTFDALQPGVLNGQYPSGLIDWGSGNWLVSGPWGAFTNNSFSFNGGAIFSASFNFLSQLRLLSLDAYNGGTGASTVTLSCPGQLNKQVTLAAGQLLTISTGWNYACSPVTISSSNGWNTNFNNLIIDAPPTAPLVISAVQATTITCAGSTINWNTNRSATSQVDYGTTTAYGTSTPLDSTLVMGHSVTLSGLAANTLYHYRVKSNDGSGTLATSGDFTFTTAAPDPNPPIISAVQVVAITNSSAYLTWITDKVSTSQADYGLTASYGTSTPLNTTVVTNHTVLLSGLSPTTIYHYRVKSRDICGNLATSADFTFTTTNAAPLSIWSSTATPAVASSSDTRAVEVGVKFTSDVNGYIMGLRFYKGSANPGTHVGNLWTSTGAPLASATFTNETASGWQQVSFATPVAITASTTYVASYHANVGGFSVDQSYFAAAGFDNAPLHALRDGVSGGNDVFLYGATSGFPTQSYAASNYWVDIVFVPPPPAISVSVSPTSASVQVGLTQQFAATVQNTTNTNVTWQVNGVTGGNSTVGTISTSGLYTAPSAVPNPATVTVVAISQADSTKSASATVTITATPPPISVSVSPTSASVQVGLTQQFAATVQNTTNTNVTWQVNGVTGGNSTVGTISTSGLYTAPSAVPNPATVTVVAISQADSTKSASATVTITATPPPISVSVSPTSASVQVGLTQQFAATVQNTTNTNVTWQVNGVTGGNSTVGTISTSGLYTAPSAVPNPATVTVVAISQADTTKSASATVSVTAASPPPTISAVQAIAITNSSAYIVWGTDQMSDSQVNYGTTTAYGTSTLLNPTLVTSHSVLLSGLTANTTYHYRVLSKNSSGNLATSGDFTFTTTNTPPLSIWSVTTTPAVASASDTSAVELGFKFTSDVNGYIIGLRFYKGTANTGTHVGNLWTSTGTLLATATFTNESASGWQQVNFATPVAITANTVYVASYHTNVGGYAVNQIYFDGVGYDNAPLHALRDGVSGGNGVYLYGVSAFPTQSFNQSNYWVDILFVPR